MRATDWQRTVTLPRFDPALGELRAVDLTIDARLDGTMGVENLAATAASLTTRLSATVAVARPGAAGATIGTAQPAVTRTDDVAAFDGTVDHAGASGRTASVSASLSHRHHPHRAGRPDALHRHRLDRPAEHRHRHVDPAGAARRRRRPQHLGRRRR